MKGYFKMGMYTGLRFKVKVKEEFYDAIQTLCNDWSWDDVTGIPNIEEWKKYSRHDFIPFGMLSYMPDEWEKECEESGHSTFKDGVWTVICSLKNYTNEIDFFLKYILAEIIEEIYYVQELYEEDDEVINYKIIINKDGKKEFEGAYR